MDVKDLGKTSLGMEANVAALLSYLLGFITGIIFYVLEKENKFVRFHAMQSILVFGSLFVLAIVVGIMPFMGWALVNIIWILDIILWVILMVKAYRGEYFKLPIAGDIAEENS
ncbi:MAG: hypothetical protein COT38_01880 [Candidatus Omnitrophica bacterium CG08_land_8_20_14_0_20_41_16]|uniref:Import component protein n=1 Tax=Candidatus Sherwoodlollariibacterium unditelluris TaxID=1974757 RepID=A0A2G9YKF9_9BACT|nr:MAG: hypothetical protein COX41_01425 [Candidatus Omnitrophica bacterium CG23_combo_of_CG06-09_8_20_14_all_41_10]PIS34128.1 MAG: hypothetical protein COT38_01880 [Candidatus Omnitrophica bacterium CG08_land_8_20_14_0_20_41_16]